MAPHWNKHPIYGGRQMGSKFPILHIKWVPNFPFCVSNGVQISRFACQMWSKFPVLHVKRDELCRIGFSCRARTGTKPCGFPRPQSPNTLETLTPQETLAASAGDRLFADHVDVRRRALQQPGHQAQAQGRIPAADHHQRRPRAQLATQGAHGGADEGGQRRFQQEPRATPAAAWLAMTQTACRGLRHANRGGGVSPAAAVGRRGVWRRVYLRRRPRAGRGTVAPGLSIWQLLRVGGVWCSVYLSSDCAEPNGSLERCELMP
jgi:hypothetical protein